MIKSIDDDLYEVICGWWHAVEADAFPRNKLPKHSYVVFKEKPIVAGILYQDDTAKFGLLGWVISNPESSREERRECLETLLDHLFEKAKEDGINPILTIMKHRYLVERLKERGFIELSNDSITLLKVF